MLEAVLRDEHTGPPSAAAIQFALQALVPTPPAAVAADSAAGEAQLRDATTGHTADAEGQQQQQSQSQQPPGDAKPSLKEQAQARRAARRQSQVWTRSQHYTVCHAIAVSP